MIRIISLALLFSITTGLISCSGNHLVKNQPESCFDKVEKALDEYNETMALDEKVLEEFIERKSAYDKQWDAFYYNLTNLQIDTLNQYKKYKNKESHIKLKKCLTPEQSDQFNYLEKELKRLEAIKIYLKKSAPLTGLMKESVLDMFKICQSIQNSQDQFAYNMIDQINRIGQDAQQRSFQTRLLNAIK